LTTLHRLLTYIETFIVYAIEHGDEYFIFKFMLIDVAGDF